VCGYASLAKAGCL